MPLPAPIEVAMSPYPSITDWISAVSTAALGLLGFVVAGWQWHRSGFCLKIRSRIDDPRQGIEIEIRNKGRIGGIISQVIVVEPDDSIVSDVTVDGFYDGSFKPIRLPAMSSMLLVIQAPKGRSFNPGVRVAVSAGKRRSKIVTPAKVPPDIGIAGLTSVLPPLVSFQNDQRFRGSP
jgi:hypothetical protein